MEDGPPGRVVPLARQARLHQGGIFALHEQDGRVLTASKDGTVALCTVTPAALTPVAHFDGFGGGVLKTVCWQPIAAEAATAAAAARLFACGGNDGELYVVDAAARTVCARVPGAHPQPISSVVFSPTRATELLTTGAGVKRGAGKAKENSPTGAFC